ncbi:MAG: SulP family inorganic anion transporter, partial [Burkholderiaceae bacterium]|nr:SulP family inorganic anion transporter [Burkholderiaceae bacterium]
GAFIVIVYGIIERYGLPNLLISTACAGVLLFLMGMFKLGTLVRYVPVSIVMGFTNGIAVLIICSQIKDFLGLQVARMPADFFAQLHVMGQNIQSFNPYAFALGLACLLGLFAWPRLFANNPRSDDTVPALFRTRAMRIAARLPGPIVALVSLTLLSWSLSLPVETIGMRFGAIPQGLPTFALPDFSWETVKLLVTPTLTIALLGAIESLLCARVADQLSTLPRHDPNQELMAQGVANFVVPFLGGMPATGTIARTVTNIRAGASTPAAGIIHALTVALVVLAAAPLALHVPLAALAGILVFVGWNMGEWRALVHLRQHTSHYRILMLGTFFLTVVFDLTVAMEVGLAVACGLFVRRMSALFSVERVAAEDGTLAYKLFGALFFGAVAKIDTVVQAVEDSPQGVVVVLDAVHLVLLDTSGLDALRQLHRSVLRRGGTLRIESVQAQPRAMFEKSGFQRELSTGVAAGAGHGA